MRDSRPAEDNTVVRRRRSCGDCGGRFTTFERVQLREVTVVKRDGKRTPFDRDKLLRSITIATRKRPFEAEQLDQLVSGIIRRMESAGEAEIPSTEIGGMVMEALAELDPVAYVRYASVYRDFKDASDFAQFIEQHSLHMENPDDTRD